MTAANNLALPTALLILSGCSLVDNLSSSKHAEERDAWKAAHPDSGNIIRVMPLGEASADLREIRGVTSNGNSFSVRFAAMADADYIARRADGRLGIDLNVRSPSSFASDPYEERHCGITLDTKDRINDSSFPASSSANSAPEKSIALSIALINAFRLATVRGTPETYRDNEVPAPLREAIANFAVSPYCRTQMGWNEGVTVQRFGPLRGPEVQ